MHRAGGTSSAAAPYSAAFRRYLSACGRRDFAGALRALDDAVTLVPTAVEPYHHRALVWRLLGDYVRSAGDRAACMAFDQWYGEREEIRRAARFLLEEYRTDDVSPAPGAADGSRHGRLRAVLDERDAQARRRLALVSRPSCDLPCPSTCCYFEDEMPAYGISLSPDEVAAVRDWLRSEGLDEEEYIGQLDVSGLPPDIPAGASARLRIDQGGGRVNFVRRRSTTLAPADDWRPRTLGYGELSWTNGRARACAFVGPSGCAIHDVGSPPGPLACRRFICLTGFVCLLLRDLGAVRQGDFASRSMAELREFSLPVLLQMSAMFGSPERGRARQQMRQALDRAVESDRAGRADDTEAALAEYLAAGGRAAWEERRARERLSAISRAFLEGSTDDREHQSVRPVSVPAGFRT